MRFCFHKIAFVALLILCINGSQWVLSENTFSGSVEKTGEKTRSHVHSAITGSRQIPQLTFQELEELAQKDPMRSELRAKVAHVLNTPMIYINPDLPLSPPSPAVHPTLHVPYLRAGEWNIERGFELPHLISVLNPETHLSATTLLADSCPPKKMEHNPEITPADIHAEEKKAERYCKNTDPQRFQETLDEKNWLSQSDVLLLTEVDNGLGRTHYRNIAKEMAQALHMHAVYAVEFIELAPLSATARRYALKSHKNIKLYGTDLDVDPKRYRGFHGSAILTRYPILSTRIIRLPQVYDWYHGEKAKLSSLEKVRREASDTVFLENMLTELRRGGRMALAVDLAIPELPEGRATFVVVHLENRAKPAGRVIQMQYLLNKLKHIHHPVVIAGDFNTTGTDVSPTSIPKEVRNKLSDPTFWSRRAISLLVPFGYIVDFGLQTTQLLHNLYDPSVHGIPVLAPNRERNFFTAIKDFQFADGRAIDIRGDKERSYDGQRGFLANSNERWLKGFVPTFSFERPLLKGLVGSYKLDWFFVKDYFAPQQEQGAQSASYLFAPHDGRTLRGINQLYPERISDHNPLTVDFPLKVPHLTDENSK